MQPGCPQGRRRIPPSLVEGRWEEEGKRGPTRPTVSSSAARRAPSPRLRRLGLPSRPAPVLPAPYSRESGSFRPPPASRASHRQAAKPSQAAPLGQPRAASAYFLSSKPHLGFQPASRVRACAECALAAVRGVELLSRCAWTRSGDVMHQGLKAGLRGARWVAPAEPERGYWCLSKESSAGLKSST